MKYVKIQNLNSMLDMGLDFYTPKLNKIALSIIIGLVTICIFTPATNWLIPLIIKKGWKFL